MAMIRSATVRANIAASMKKAYADLERDMKIIVTKRPKSRRHSDRNKGQDQPEPEYRSGGSDYHRFRLTTTRAVFSAR